MADDGAGLQAVRLLAEKVRDLPVTAAENPTFTFNVDLIEAGTPGMTLLHQFDEREKIIFIDAGNCGIQPGEYRRFTPDQVSSLKKNPNVSLHEFDLIQLLEFASQVFKRKIDVSIYCIQALDINISEKLSPVVSDALPLLVEDVYHELRACMER